MNTEIKTNPLKEKSFALAIRIVRLNQFLTSQKNEYVISKQILRSGTNPGAMVREANNAEPAMDFIHKLAIGQKELVVIQYWLELLFKTDYITETEFNSIFNDTTEVMKIIRSSIITKKKNLAIKALPLIICLGFIDNYFL
jgi:four helix bundle protein